MRRLFRIVFAPVMLVLRIVILLLAFVLSISTSLLSIGATLLGLIVILVFFVDSKTNGLWLLILAWLISPYGIPLAAGWLLERIDGLWTSIQDKIYY